MVLEFASQASGPNIVFVMCVQAMTKKEAQRAIKSYTASTERHFFVKL